MIKELKPVMLEYMDPNQFGFVPKSCTTFALTSMLHRWLEATDGTGSYARATLLDYPCIRRLSPQYVRQSKLSCPTDNLFLHR